MCNMNCCNCYYRQINPKDDKGHCYMFRHEPEGDCKLYKNKTVDVASDPEQHKTRNILSETNILPLCVVL